MIYLEEMGQGLPPVSRRWRPWPLSPALLFNAGFPGIGTSGATK